MSLFEAAGEPLAPRLPPGVVYRPGFFDAAAQAALLAEIRAGLTDAPFLRPEMPRTGKPFSVEMTNRGALGWVSDRSGYRYQPRHPVTGRHWPPIPDALLSLWRALAHYPHDPQACLVNLYRGNARMGLHQDRDEEDFDAPVLSVSLGDDCLFRIGGTARGGPTVSLRLASGDVLVLGGESRLAFHGVDRVYPDTGTLLGEGGGRINLTLRRVTRPSAGDPAPSR